MLGFVNFDLGGYHLQNIAVIETHRHKIDILKFQPQEKEKNKTKINRNDILQECFLS